MTSLALVGLVALIATSARLNRKDWSGQRPLLSALNVVIALYILYVLLPAILVAMNHGEFVWAPGYESEGGFLNTILACILGLGSFIYGNVIQKSMHQRRSFVARTKVSAARHSPPIDETLDWLLPILLITFGMLIKLYVIWSLGGPSGAIARLSGGARDRLDLYDANAPLIALRTLSGIADAGATWLLINCVRRRKRLLLPLIIFSLVLATSYITIGKRLVLILPIVAVLLAWHSYRRRLTLRAAPWALVLVTIFGIASLFFRIYLPASIAHISINLEHVAYAQGSPLLFYFYSLEFSTVEMITVSMRSAAQINEMFGGRMDAFWTTNIVPFSYGIPRALMPGKPDAFYDLSHAVSSVLIGTNLHDSQVGYASTIIGTSYIIGGLVGIVVMMFLFGWVVGIIDHQAQFKTPSTRRIIWHALQLTLVFQFFRQGTLGWTFIVTIVQQYGFVLALIVLGLPVKLTRHMYRNRERDISVNP